MVGGGGGVAALTVISALAVLVPSCWDATVTVPCPAVVPVNRPLALMEPKFAGATVQVMPVLEPVTVPINCSVACRAIVALGGDIFTVIGAGGGAVPNVPMR